MGKRKMGEIDQSWRTYYCTAPKLGFNLLVTRLYCCKRIQSLKIPKENEGHACLESAIIHKHFVLLEMHINFPKGEWVFSSSM